MNDFDLALMLCLFSFVVGVLFGVFLAVSMTREKGKGYLVKWIDYDYKKIYLREIEDEKN